MKMFRGLMRLTRYGLWLLVFMLVAVAVIVLLTPSYPSQAKYVLDPITVNINLASFKTIPITAIGPISGTPRVQETLTTGTLTPSGATATYQWMRSSASDGIYDPIVGGTSSSYALTVGDYAYYIKVQATGTGTYTGTVLSQPIGPVTLRPISIATISGVTVPVTGVNATTTLPETTEYTATISWSPVPTGGIFQSATQYTATITVTPKTGYTLSGVPSNFFTVSGASATNLVDSGLVTSVFPSTNATPLESVAISGNPQVGQTLNAVLTPSGAIATYQWQWSTTAGGTYTAISGADSSTYTITGPDVDKFIKVTATGTVSYSGTLISTAVGPVSPKIISISAISGVTVPVMGSTGAPTISPTVEYTGTISWTPALVNGVFANITVYTARITLTPNTGYTLSGVPANFFTVADATSVSNPANSGVITAVFPSTTIPISAIGNITGTTQVGYTLTAGAVTPSGATVTYQWQRNGTAISGATSSTYVLTGTDANQYINVTATGTGSYFGTVTNTAVGPVEQATLINISSITGITVPVKNAAPDYSMDANSQYTGGITWQGLKPKGDFEPNVPYIATITITALPGFTLTGLPDNFFTVSGASTTTTTINPNNTATVTATYSAN